MLSNFPLQIALAKQHEQGLYRSLNAIETGVTPILTLDGKDYINFASNDYLGLATDPYLADIFTKTAQQIGQVGSGASHLITGHSVHHENLDKTLAHVTGYEKAITFSTGYMANVGVIQALANKDTVIFSDKLNHASIIDGCILSRAKLVRFNHRNYEQLENLLKQTTATQKLIVTDHVFSMDGTIADLDVLHDLAQKYEYALMVDDAHGFGLPYQAYHPQCPHPNPLPEGEGLQGKADIYMGTFGKAIGTSGAFVAGSGELIDYLVNFARPFIYTTALPPALAYTTEASVLLARNDETLQYQLLSNINHLSYGLVNQGWQVLSSKGTVSQIGGDMPKTAIIPVLIGDNERAVHLANALKETGFWVSAIRPPTVPVGTARLRFCVSSSHSTEQITYLLEVMQTLK